jgi:ABC-2 type transport system permease protein
MVAMAAREVAKLPAFMRRDLLIAWSYRIFFLTDLVNLLAQTITFYFIARLVDSSRLPAFGDSHATYMEFVAIGIGFSVFVQFGLTRVSTAIRNEQLTGTLESVLMTPTRPATVQFGSLIFDLAYVPLRTAIFLGIAAAAFGLNFYASGLAPAMFTLVIFMPFVWGLGIAAAGIILTVRRGNGGLGVVTLALGLLSGAYFPLTLLPDAVQWIAEKNPLAIALDGMRQALLGGSGWSHVAEDVLVLLPVSAAALALGMWVFRLALRRERRLGTIGLY